MASLLESLGQSLTPETVGTISNALGLEPQMVQQGVNVVGPLVQGGLATTASTPQGLDGLMQMLQPLEATPAPGDAGGGLGGLLSMFGGGGAAGGSSDDMLGSLLSAATGQGGGMVNMLLNLLFGAGAIAAIGATLDKKLGFKVSPLLVLVAPMLLNQLRKLLTEQKLDANGVANLLQQEQQRFVAEGGETATLVQEATQAGQAAAALRSQFTAQEWTTVRLAPMAAAVVVMSASPSGPAGAIKEVTAAMHTIAASQAAAAPTSLLNIALADPLTDEEKTFVEGETPKPQLLAAISDAVGLVASKDGSEGASYRQLVITVATNVAEASKEGGFLGFGGKKVSDAEKAVLAEIRAAIGV